MSATTAYAPARGTAAAPVVERRVSLSRGPALIVGTILLAAGLYFLFRSHVFPRFANFTGGRAPVNTHAFFGIFGINGWTGMLTAIAGGLLLFGAAEHFLSKTMSLIVGACLAAAAIIALISGDVLGLAAANGWTELGWGVAAAILLVNAVLPARRRVVAGPVVADGAVAGRPRGFLRTRRITSRPGGPAPVAERAPVGGPASVAEPVAQPDATGPATAGPARPTGASTATREEVVR